MKKVRTCAAHVIAGAALQIGRVAPCYGHAIHETKGVATSKDGLTCPTCPAWQV